MFSRAICQQRQVLTNSVRTVAKRIYLKTEALDLLSNRRQRTEVPYPVDTFIGYDKRQQLLIQYGILDQRSVRTETALKCTQGERVNRRLSAMPVTELTRKLR